MAQGISTARDRYGNLIRDNGIAGQNAPRPISNRAINLAPNYVVRVRPRVIVVRRR
jgi:hypothetical protein